MSSSKLILLVTSLMSLIGVGLFGFSPLNVRGVFSEKYLNSELMKVSSNYPQNSYITQTPASEVNGTMGITKSIVYDGKVVYRDSNTDNAYCSGLIFETYLQAMQNKAPFWKSSEYLGLSSSEFKAFQKQFYGADGNEKTLCNALLSNDLAEPVIDLDDAVIGDLVQFWRNNKTGHTVIYRGGKFTSDGTPVSIKYWSIQSAGLGDSEEFIGNGVRDIDSSRIYIVRAKMP